MFKLWNVVFEYISLKGCSRKIIRIFDFFSLARVSPYLKSRALKLPQIQFPEIPKSSTLLKLWVVCIAEDSWELLSFFFAAIADVHKNEGNEAFKKGDFINAIHFYTKGIKMNCNDKELKAKLYNNRAIAHFKLGKMMRTLICIFFLLKLRAISCSFPQRL